MSKFPFLLFTLITFNFIFSQTTVCEGSPCTSNDFTVDNFFLGDEHGTPLDNGFCNPGDIIQTHLWVNFTANAAAPRYSLYLHFNLYYDGVFIETKDECYYNLMAIPIGVPLDTGIIDWECGTEISITDLYMSWQTNDSSPCDCSRSHCISEQIIIVQTPLISSFEYTNSCEIDFLVNFTSTSSGGQAPHTYLWDFGDGTTSTLENPSHIYPHEGPFIVTLTVTDANGFDSIQTEIVSFNSGTIPLTITPPVNLNIEGCDISALTSFPYSDIPISITEDELITMGGNINHYTDLSLLTYVDSYSGSCPIEITRTFNAEDSCNTTATAIQLIQINDTINPELVSELPSNISISCGLIPEAPELEFSDNCSTILDIEFNETIISTNINTYTILRAWTAVDECGNSSNFTQEVFVSNSNEREIISTNLCVEDAPIDLSTFITNTTVLTGTWQSQFPDILNGSIFNPSNVEIGSYEFTYSYTNNDCIFKTIVNVGMHEDCIECIQTTINDISISKIVTPNNDESNDYFEIKHNSKNTNRRFCQFSISLDIYNRWGTRVYSNSNYDNSWQGASPINALGPSNKLPTGTYYYVIKFNNTLEKTDAIQGYLYLGSN